MDRRTCGAIRKRAERRGGTYVLVLTTMMIATTLGVSGVLTARVHHRTAELSGDFAAARVNALAGIDLALFIIDQNPTQTEWRNHFGNGAGPIENLPLGRGTVSCLAVDEGDGDLNNGPDPVVLTGVGEVGDAVYKIEVRLDGDGAVVPGTYQRVVD